MNPHSVRGFFLTFAVGRQQVLFYVCKVHNADVMDSYKVVDFILSGVYTDR